MELEKKEYDLIVLGTGVVESIVAGAAARVGKSVLHLDANDCYGGQWSSFDLTSFEQKTSDGITEDRTEFAPLRKQSRHFSIDLNPQILVTAGSLVDTLINSGVGKYLEFKKIEKPAMFSSGALNDIPQSKSDVFRSTLLGHLEKRALMKFVNSCGDSPEDPTITPASWAERPFLDYLNAFKLSPKVQEFVLYAIAFARTGDAFTTAQGCAAVRACVSAVGRFGENVNSLATIFGTAEFPQAFCRLCAVYGGVYMLRSPAAPYVEGATCTGVLTATGERLSSLRVVCSSEYARQYVRPAQKFVARAVCVLTTPLRDVDISYVTIPPNAVGNEELVTVIQLDHSTSCVPDGHFLIHLSTFTSSDSPQAALEPALRALLTAAGATDPPLYSRYFSIQRHEVDPATVVPFGLHICSDAVPFSGLQSAMDEAVALFQRLFPDQPFIPPMPSPEEQSQPTNADEEETNADEEQTNEAEAEQGAEQ